MRIRYFAFCGLHHTTRLTYFAYTRALPATVDRYTRSSHDTSSQLPVISVEGIYDIDDLINRIIFMCHIIG